MLSVRRVFLFLITFRGNWTGKGSGKHLFSSRGRQWVKRVSENRGFPRSEIVDRNALTMSYTGYQLERKLIFCCNTRWWWGVFRVKWCFATWLVRVVARCSTPLQHQVSPSGEKSIAEARVYHHRHKNPFQRDFYVAYVIFVFPILIDTLQTFSP